MLSRSERILVAVSGGKDSASVLFALERLGYNVEGIFIKMGLQTLLAERTVFQLGQVVGAKLHILDVTEHLNGLGTADVAKAVKRPVCSVCGVVRRYWMNRFAVENGFDVVVTGHNMDDEASFLLGNLLNWQVEYLERQWPVLEKTHPKFVRKVKPLIYVTERETYAYAFLNQLPFVEQKCPFAKGATSSLYKKYLNALEWEQPGLKHRFLFGSFEHLKKTFHVLGGADDESTPELRACSVCGYPTVEEKCQYCKIVMRIQDLQGGSAELGVQVSEG